MKNINKKNLLFLSFCFSIISFNTSFAAAAAESNVNLQGTLFKAGSINELRIKTASDFRAMNGKTLRLTVDSKPIEFGIKNVTRAAYKGANNQIIFNALNEVLNVNENADDSIYEQIVNVEKGDQSYEKLIKSLNSGSLNSSVELVEVQLFDESYNAKSSNKITMHFVVGGGEYTNGNLAAKTEEEEKILNATQTTATVNKKKMGAAISLITKNKKTAKNINVSLNKIGAIVSSDVFDAVQLINSNSLVSFRYRNTTSKALLYEWQVTPNNIWNPKQINLKLSFKSNKIDEIVKKYNINRYKTITMQTHGSLGAKLTVGAKLNFANYNKNSLKLYSIDTKTGNIERKNQIIFYDDQKQMIYFSTAYGENYIITDEEIAL
ncbi:MAG: hypothetical protein ACI4PK_03140 [Oscillospiraceae bacterium]